MILMNLCPRNVMLIIVTVMKLKHNTNQYTKLLTFLPLFNIKQIFILLYLPKMDAVPIVRQGLPDCILNHHLAAYRLGVDHSDGGPQKIFSD